MADKKTPWKRITHEQVMTTLRTLMDSCASSMVTKYINGANAWIDNASAVAATQAEFKRVEQEMLAAFERENFVLLKRFKNNHGRQPRKRMKILDSNQTDSNKEFIEYTGGGVYDVVGGMLTAPDIEAGTARLTASRDFDLSSMVKESSSVNYHDLGIPKDSYGRHLQLKQHITSIGQAFMHKETGGDQTLFNEEHLETWANTRFQSSWESFEKEYADACAMFARTLTLCSQRKQDKWVVELDGLPPYLLSFYDDDTKGCTTATSPGGTQYVFEMEQLDANVLFFKCMQIYKGTNKMVFEIQVYVVDKSVTFYNVKDGHSVSLFQLSKPLQRNTDNKVFDRHDLSPLYDLTTVNNERVPKLGNHNDYEVLDVAYRDADDSTDENSSGQAPTIKFVGDDISSFTEFNGSRNAWMSTGIYEPSLQKLAKTGGVCSHAAESTELTQFLTDNNVNVAETEFEKGVRNHISSNIRSLDYIKLVPLSIEDTNMPVASLGNISFQTNITKDKKLEWFIGSSPLPAMDAIEGAFACINLKIT